MKSMASQKKIQRSGTVRMSAFTILETLYDEVKWSDTLDDFLRVRCNCMHFSDIGSKPGVVCHFMNHVYMQENGRF
jgi:hypothetical protein